MRLGIGVNDPAPSARCNGAAITPRPASSTELVSDDFPALHQLLVLPLIEYGKLCARQ